MQILSLYKEYPNYYVVIYLDKVYQFRLVANTWLCEEITYHWYN